MIRLLSIQPVAERGGSDQAILRLFRGLRPDEFTCHLAVPADPPLRPELERAGVTVHIVPMERISTSHGARTWFAYALGWPLTVYRLVRIIRANRIDVVHTNSLHSWYGWAAAWLTRRPHVWHAREITVQSGMALKVERFLTRHFATQVICMSQAIADQFPDANTVVVYETADPAEFNPARAGHFRAAAGVPDDVVCFGAAGRVDSWKGFDVLLEAFASAVAKRDDIHLVFAGGPVAGKQTLYDTLERRAGEIANVHWLGPRTDMPEVYADLDCFVLPTTEAEPYGLVVVEALASGTPVIATDAGGPREIAAAAEPGSATLVPPGNVAALCDALLVRAGETHSTSTAQRQARASLRAENPDPFSPLFQELVP
jgi:glycosyltransferase involved in cell wall biosynthesis